MSAHIERLSLQRSLFPEGVPRLWCPTLTHFSNAHVPDAQRIREHLEALAPYAKGILIPGSTGEGWEMDDRDVRKLLSIVLPAAEAVGVKVLLGVLKTELGQMLGTLDELQDLCQHPAVVGVTVCPPRGAELSQFSILDAMRNVLKRGQATALYQLPQVTKNEMSPESVATLADEFANFILFKDTSGQDRVAMSGLDFGGITFLRGSEQGGYSKWTQKSGGPYDGFLLSTANTLAPELSQVLQLLDAGDVSSAKRLSDDLESLVTAMFELVHDVPVGNAFTNANKVLFHLRTHGAMAVGAPMPLLYSGQYLAPALIERALDTVRTQHPWFLCGPSAGSIPC
jgi:dihydrodipicolinate synthase/N-acetylneuraminate lyase